jgi:hypothetical protein
LFACIVRMCDRPHHPNLHPPLCCLHPPSPRLPHHAHACSSPHPHLRISTRTRTRTRTTRSKIWDQ